MTRRWLAVFAFISVLALCAPSLAADSGKGKGKGQSQGASKDKDKSHGNSAMQDDDADKGKHDKDKGKDKDKDKYKDKDKDRDEAWEHRGSYEYRTYGANDDRPPGWSRGNKTGWGNCDVPPGQAKKGSCRTYIHQGHRYYYYYDDHDRMVLRRHVIQQR